MAMENGEPIQAENSAKQLWLVRLQSSPEKMKEKKTEDYKTMSPMASKFKTCNGQLSAYCNLVRDQQKGNQLLREASNRSVGIELHENEVDRLT